MPIVKIMLSEISCSPVFEKAKFLAKGKKYFELDANPWFLLMGVCDPETRGYLAWLMNRGLLPRIHLDYMDLSYLDLSNAKLNGAELTGANLMGANLSNADLYSTNLIRADLRGACLSGAHLGNANLYAANLSGVDLSGAKYNDSTIFPEGFKITKVMIKW